jgi:3D (Asp-Asp-Asp) domain-containing protein
MTKKPAIFSDLIIKILLVGATILLYWFIWTAWSRAVVADTKEEIPVERSEIIIIQGNSLVGLSAPFYPKVQVLATITAYSSEPEQTDDTPFVTASGKRVRKGIAACPRDIPFGTEIEIDGEVYICEDRMSQKYDGRFDVWMKTEEEAWEFGRQLKEVKILE